MKKLLPILLIGVMLFSIGMVAFASPRMENCPARPPGYGCSPVERVSSYRDGCYMIIDTWSECEYCGDFITDLGSTEVGYFHNWLSNGFCSECGASFNAPED